MKIRTYVLSILVVIATLAVITVISSRPRTKTFTVLQDINKDGATNGHDVALFSASFGRTVANGADPRADINGDGRVDEYDKRLVIATAK